jgi:hypothetical protein
VLTGIAKSQCDRSLVQLSRADNQSLSNETKGSRMLIIATAVAGVFVAALYSRDVDNALESLKREHARPA